VSSNFKLNSMKLFLSRPWRRGGERKYGASHSLPIMKAKEMHYFSNLFDKVLYMVRTCPLSIISSISTLYKRNRYLSW